MNFTFPYSFQCTFSETWGKSEESNFSCFEMTVGELYNIFNQFITLISHSKEIFDTPRELWIVYLEELLVLLVLFENAQLLTGQWVVVTVFRIQLKASSLKAQQITVT